AQHQEEGGDEAEPAEPDAPDVAITQPGPALVDGAQDGVGQVGRIDGRAELFDGAPGRRERARLPGVRAEPLEERGRIVDAELLVEKGVDERLEARVVRARGLGACRAGAAGVAHTVPLSENVRASAGLCSSSERRRRLRERCRWLLMVPSGMFMCCAMTEMGQSC